MPGDILSCDITGAPVLRSISVCRCVVRIPDLGRIQAVYKRQVANRGSGGTRLSSQNHYRLSNRGHAMSGSRRGRRPHVLKGVPAKGADPKSSQIAEVCPFFRAAAENVHNIVDYGRGMAFPRRRNVANTIKLRPEVGHGVITPYVVKPLKPIGAAKPKQRQRTIPPAIRRSGNTYRYSLSLYVTTVWLVLAGGSFPWGGAPLSLFGMSISQRLLGICNWFKSKAARSFMK